MYFHKLSCSKNLSKCRLCLEKDSGYQSGVEEVASNSTKDRDPLSINTNPSKPTEGYLNSFVGANTLTSENGNSLDYSVYSQKPFIYRSKSRVNDFSVQAYTRTSESGSSSDHSVYSQELSKDGSESRFNNRFFNKRHNTTTDTMLPGRQGANSTTTLKCGRNREYSRAFLDISPVVESLGKQEQPATFKKLPRGQGLNSPMRANSTTSESGSNTRYCRKSSYREQEKVKKPRHCKHLTCGSLDCGKIQTS